MKEIRTLRADEIDVRVGTQHLTGKNKGVTLLLYKDARVDMNILDETYGVNGWQRHHEGINDKLFCTIEVWDSMRSQWIKKQDVGTESYSEKAKGEASDSFKRAGVNVGIGRELYTSPFMWVNLNDNEVKDGKVDRKLKFKVLEIGYNEKREINYLTIADQKGNIRYNYSGIKEDSDILPTTLDILQLLTPEQKQMIREKYGDVSQLKERKAKEIIKYFFTKQ